MLREKEGDLDDLEALNQTLIVKERKSNDELQDARKELVNDKHFILLFSFWSALVVFFSEVRLKKLQVQ